MTVVALNKSAKHHMTRTISSRIRYHQLNVLPGTSQRRKSTLKRPCIQILRVETKMKLIICSSKSSQITGSSYNFRKTIQLCQLKCTIPLYKDWSSRMIMDKLCPHCENYEFRPAHLEASGDWHVRSTFFTGRYF